MIPSNADSHGTLQDELNNVTDIKQSVLSITALVAGIKVGIQDSRRDDKSVS